MNMGRKEPVRLETYSQVELSLQVIGGDFGVSGQELIPQMRLSGFRPLDPP
jgi:hypothetical protein